jgi:hypothetical protein
MDLRLTPHLDGYALRFWSPEAEEVIATFPDIDAAWDALKAARRAAFQLRMLTNV